jgi:hypothetical protein
MRAIAVLRWNDSQCAANVCIFCGGRKMKRLILLLMVATVVLWTAGTAQAVDYDFVDTGDGLWTTLANWKLAGGVPATQLPTNDDWVKVSNQSPSTQQTVTIGAGVNALALKTHIGYTAFGGTLNIIDGGTLTHKTAADGDLLIGKTNGNGVLNLVNGTIGCRDLEVGGAMNGTGTLNMTSGTINVWDDFEIGISTGSTGIVHLDGGTIKLDGSFEGVGSALLRMYVGGSMNFGGGTLILPGDQRSRIKGYVDSGWITSSLGEVKTDLDMNPGFTTVYAIPEPATMVLLGLGGLLLRKRR